MLPLPYNVFRNGKGRGITLEQKESKCHNIKIENRENISIDGVEDVIGFDDSAVALVTALGILNLEGVGLHIIKLDVNGSGCVEISGMVNALYYTDNSSSKKRRLFARRID